MSISDKISIIVPCYNQAQYLPEALDSVLEQSYHNWECIIVDDGSPDNTFEIANRYCEIDKRFKYLHKENGGISSARNAGINIATGKYILPLDADDYIHKDYISKAMAEFTNDTSVDVVYSYGRFFGASNGDMNVHYSSYETIILWNQVFCSAIYDRLDFLKTGGYNTDMRDGLEDWEFWVRFLADKKVFQIPEVLFYYRIKEVSRNQQVDANIKMRQSLETQVYLLNLQTYVEKFGSPIEIMRNYEQLKVKKGEEKAEIAKDVRELIYNSASYKLGNALLTPFRAVNFLLKRLTKRSVFLNSAKT